MRSVLVAVGGGSAAIRIVPLLQRLQSQPQLHTLVHFAARHRRLLGQTLGLFGIEETAGLQLEEGTNAPGEIDRAIARHRPDSVLVFGDGAATGSSIIPAESDHGQGSLRECRLAYPNPADDSRGKVVQAAEYFLVSTPEAREQLLAGGVPSARVHVEGCLLADALLMAVERIRGDTRLQARLLAALPMVDPARRLILVAGHRHGRDEGRMAELCRALRRLATRPDVQVIHLLQHDAWANRRLEDAFASQPNIVLLPPQEHLHFAFLLHAAGVVMADTGDTLEALVPLGKPVLVLRDMVERPQAVDAGNVRLVGTDVERIVNECNLLLDDPAYYRAFTLPPRPPCSDLFWQRIVEHQLP